MKVRITTKDFISFLKLFESSEKIEELQFGDTCYKARGYINESILNGNHNIGSIIELNYKFNGLVDFEGKIKEYQIILIASESDDQNFEFEIESTQTELRKLENKVIERNAYLPGSFSFSYIDQYDN